VRRLLLFCIAGLLGAEPVVLKSLVLDCGGAKVAGGDCVTRLSLGQTIASGVLHSVTYSGTLGFWHPVRPGGGVSEQAGLRPPAALHLSEPRPSPVATAAVVRYALPRAAPVRLQLLDPAGRVLGTLVDARQSAGWHRVHWSVGARIGAGVYFLQLQALGQRVARKIVVSI
jgi:hypothetical protein